MFIYSIIKKFQLEGAHRLDAEYYQPEYLEVSQKLRDAQRISELTNDIRYGLYVEPDYKEEGVQFIRALNLLNFHIDGEILKIYENKVPSDYRLKVGDLLIVRSGANTGSIGLVYPRLENATFGSYTIRLRFNKVSPSFAAIFLNTKYGVLQTKRLQTGMAQPNLNIPNIKEIKVPIIAEEEQREIETLCLEIEKQRQQSESFYSQAKQILLEELGLQDFSVKDGLWSVVKLSDVKKVERMDAEYFQLKYHMLEEKLKKYGVKSFTEIIQEVPAKFDPKTKADQTFQYVELSNINAAIGAIEGSSEVLGKEVPSRARCVLKTGDVVVSSVEGSLGKVALVDSAQDGYLASTGFFQLRSNEILPEALLMLAKSIVFNWQLQQRTAGTILTAVPGESLKSVLVPLLSKPTQQKIAELVRKSHEARKKAKELLEEAKRAVENLIEKRQHK